MKQSGVTVVTRMGVNSPRNCYGTATENKQMRVKWRSKIDSGAIIYRLEKVGWQMRTGLNLAEWVRSGMNQGGWVKNDVNLQGQAKTVVT